jgi:flagellar basal body-associated protein FliL
MSLAHTDPITIIISILAFVISAGVAGFNWWAWKKKNLEDAQKALTEAVVGMITTRQKLEEFRTTSGEKFGNSTSLAWKHLLKKSEILLCSTH